MKKESEDERMCCLYSLNGFNRFSFICCCFASVITLRSPTFVHLFLSPEINIKISCKYNQHLNKTKCLVIFLLKIIKSTNKLEDDHTCFVSRSKG